MRDPYLYEDIPILKNKLNIHKKDLLDKFIFQDIFDWADQPRVISIYKEEDVLGGLSIEYSDPFDIVNDICHVLSDMRAKKWNNMNRSQLANEFCDSLANLWRIHPFREGNVTMRHPQKAA